MNTPEPVIILKLSMKTCTLTLDCLLGKTLVTTSGSLVIARTLREIRTTPENQIIGWAVDSFGHGVHIGPCNSPEAFQRLIYSQSPKSGISLA